VALARRHLTAALELIEPAWRAEQTEGLRLWLARTRLLEGEIAQREHDTAGASVAWTQARQLLLADATPSVPFGRLDALVRVLHNLGQHAEAAPHRRRLEAAGYVPLQPFPAPERVATQ
jgi:hypothetical protein